MLRIQEQRNPQPMKTEFSYTYSVRKVNIRLIEYMKSKPLNILTNTRKFVKNNRIWTHFPREPVTSPILNTFNNLLYIYIPEMRNARVMYMMKNLSSLVYLKLNGENVNFKNIYTFDSNISFQKLFRRCRFQ